MNIYRIADSLGRLKASVCWSAYFPNLSLLLGILHIGLAVGFFDLGCVANLPKVGLPVFILSRHIGRLWVFVLQDDICRVEMLAQITSTRDPKPLTVGSPHLKLRCKI